MITQQLSVFVENKTGRINIVTKTLGENNINMKAFSLAESSDFGILRMIVSDADLAKKVLKEAGFAVKLTSVICFKCKNVPGSLNVVLDALAEEGVFIEYMYAFADGEQANVVIRPTSIDDCMDIMTKLKLV